jgi:hypothetical protein
MSNEIVKKPSFAVKTPVGLAARRAAVNAMEPARAATAINPMEMEHRVGIVFDDSGSMAGGWSGATAPIDNAHAGVEEFLRSCKPQTTAVAVYPMNAAKLKLSSDLPSLAMLVKKIKATGGTPALSTLSQMITAEKLTRAILFSDGEYYGYEFDIVVAQCRAAKIPVDTVFIGDASEVKAIEDMQKLAEATGGIFLHFDPSKSNFRTAFKYLSPGYRAMLADKSFADKIQGK